MSRCFIFHEYTGDYLDPIELFNRDDWDLVAARCYGNDFNDEDNRVLIIEVRDGVSYSCPASRSLYDVGGTSVYDLHCELVMIENTKKEELPLLIGALKNKRAEDYLERLLKGGESLRYKYCIERALKS